jgi:hypothetical protein
MSIDLDVYCSTCFALPGELCRSKFLVYGGDEVMPIICPTHNTRLIAAQRKMLRHSLARQLLTIALSSLRGK